MADQAFKLQCACEQIHEVRPKQAGSTVHCSCGQRIEVPTLRALRQLPPVETPSDRHPRESVWSRQQGALFVLGFTTIIIAGSCAGWSVWRSSFLRTEPPKVQDLRYTLDIMTLNPGQSWEAWLGIRNIELGARGKPNFQSAREYALQLRIYCWVGVAFMAVGLALVVASFCMRNPHRPRAI